MRASCQLDVESGFERLHETQDEVRGGVGLAERERLQEWRRIVADIEGLNVQTVFLEDALLLGEAYDNKAQRGRVPDDRYLMARLHQSRGGKVRGLTCMPGKQLTARGSGEAQHSASVKGAASAFVVKVRGLFGAVRKLGHLITPWCVHEHLRACTSAFPRNNIQIAKGVNINTR